MQVRGKKKWKETKNTNLKPKENQNSSDGASGSKKKKKFEKAKCSYCMGGFHLESQCVTKTINDLSKLPKQNNIAFPQSARKFEEGQYT